MRYQVIVLALLVFILEVTSGLESKDKKGDELSSPFEEEELGNEEQAVIRPLGSRFTNEKNATNLYTERARRKNSGRCKRCKKFCKRKGKGRRKKACKRCRKRCLRGYTFKITNKMNVNVTRGECILSLCTDEHFALPPNGSFKAGVGICLLLKVTAYYDGGHCTAYDPPHPTTYMTYEVRLNEGTSHPGYCRVCRIGLC